MDLEAAKREARDVTDAAQNLVDGLDKALDTIASLETELSQWQDKADDLGSQLSDAGDRIHELEAMEDKLLTADALLENAKELNRLALDG